MNKYIGNNYKLFFVVIFLSILAVNLTPAKGYAELPERCKGKKWNNTDEYMDCVYPPPPIGRWKAVYTKEFANEHNLPKENISKDFSEGVDYMEMDVQPYSDRGGVACLVNMLVKNPNDIAFHKKLSKDRYSWAKELHERRKLTRFIDLEDYKGKLKKITSFASSSRDYDYRLKKGFMSSTFAFYIEGILPNYDYITANYSCGSVSTNPNYFPNGYAFWVSKASVWGKYDQLYGRLEDVNRPKGDELHNSHFFINIPKELIEAIFKDVPVGGK